MSFKVGESVLIECYRHITANRWVHRFYNGNDYKGTCQIALIEIINVRSTGALFDKYDCKVLWPDGAIETGIAWTHYPWAVDNIPGYWLKDKPKPVGHNRFEVIGR